MKAPICDLEDWGAPRCPTEAEWAALHKRAVELGAAMSRHIDKLLADILAEDSKTMTEREQLTSLLGRLGCAFALEFGADDGFCEIYPGTPGTHERIHIGPAKSVTLHFDSSGVFLGVTDDFGDAPASRATP